MAIASTTRPWSAAASFAVKIRPPGGFPRGGCSIPPGEADAPAAEVSFAQRHFFAAHRTRDPFGNFATTRSDPYVLLALETNDAVGNRMLAEQDYRVLQPL